MFLNVRLKLFSRWVRESRSSHLRCQSFKLRWLSICALKVPQLVFDFFALRRVFGCFRRRANVTKHHQFSVRKNIRLPGKLMTADCLLFNPRRVVLERTPAGAKNQIAQQLSAFHWKTIPSRNHYALRFHNFLYLSFYTLNQKFVV